MGFLDSVSSAVSRGTASVQRSGKTAQLKMQMNELMKQRRDLAAQLGASVYDTVKDMPEIRKGREVIFLSIEDVDKQRAEIEEQIAQIEAVAAARAAAGALACPKCGAAVEPGDLFCVGCGMPAAEIRAAASSGARCPKCSEPLEEDDAFCMSCGAKVEPKEEAGAEVPSDGAPSCPICGEPFEEGDVFCTSCGARLEG